MTVIPLFPEGNGHIIRAKGQITVTGTLKDGTESPIAAMSTLLTGQHPGITAAGKKIDDNALVDAVLSDRSVEKIVRNPNAPDGTNCIVYSWSFGPKGTTTSHRSRLKEHGYEVLKLLEQAGMSAPIISRLTKPQRILEKLRHKAGLEL
jgi:hypothetical protein